MSDETPRFMGYPVVMVQTLQDSTDGLMWCGQPVDWNDTKILRNIIRYFVDRQQVDSRRHAKDLENLVP